jgi:micrococcal nuclease
MSDLPPWRVNDPSPSPTPRQPRWHRVWGAYRRWPTWARVAGPAAVVVTLVLTSGGDGGSEPGVIPPVEVAASVKASTTSTAPIAVGSKTSTTLRVRLDSDPVAVTTPTAIIETTPPVRPSNATAATVGVAGVIDGDTIEVSDGARIRLIGIDTPERGECGYSEATAYLARLVGGNAVVLVSGARDDVDRYGRLLRYVEVEGIDANLEMIRSGLAIARYDSRDGYGRHDREDEYIGADIATPSSIICETLTTTTASPTPSQDGGVGGRRPSLQDM